MRLFRRNRGTGERKNRRTGNRRTGNRKQGTENGRTGGGGQRTGEQRTGNREQGTENREQKNRCWYSLRSKLCALGASVVNSSVSLQKPNSARSRTQRATRGTWQR
ncbi:hypothetical protein CJ255_15105 [Candidatus Viridilinea mediisalina]|uniref:Uncharacterized protein n=1 Tax=Candidatus Viridilinea mediisalina TaxID=2024553 RepID=A0A2A6RH46_9CHLR|nr:hypothetical protein CJ255_15105 [Candidatus Viridilinea mediisalina]